MAIDRLSETEFEKAIAGRRFAESTVAVTRRVMVDGLSVAQAVTEFSISKKRLYRMLELIRSAWLEASLYPKDWVTAQVIAPKDKLEAFLKEVEHLRIKAFQSER